MVAIKSLDAAKPILDIKDRLDDLEKYGIYTSLADLKNAKAGNFPYSLVTRAGRIEYSYVVNDFSGKADDVFVIQLNSVDLATGALVRQSSDNVGYTSSFIPSAPRPVNRVLDDHPTITSLGVTEDSPDNSTKLAEIIAKARDLAIHTANPPRIHVPAGIYKYTNSPNFAVQGLHLDCEPGAQFVHTGSGVAFNVDGGATGGGIGLMKVTGGLVIRGNQNTTDGMFNRAIHHSTFDVEIQNVTKAGLRTKWCVCNEYWLRISPIYRPAFSPVPTFGILLSSRNTGEKTSRCNFYNPIFEGINGYGIVLDDAIINTFLGGTSESNVGGIYISPNSSANIIDGLDMEFNTTIDVFDQGAYNTFRNCLSDSKSDFSGLLTTVTGGLWNQLYNKGNSNTFSNINYAIAGGTFENTGLDSVLHMIRNAVTGVIAPDTVDHPLYSLILGDYRVNGVVEGFRRDVDGTSGNQWYRYKYGSDPAHYGGTGGVKISHGADGLSFFGVPLKSKIALPAAGTDLATTQTLTNAIAELLIGFGLGYRV